MGISEFAGKKAPKEILENIPNLISDYYLKVPDIKILLIWYLLEPQDIEEVLQKIVLMKII